jgi:hypothetical protein
MRLSSLISNNSKHPFWLRLPFGRVGLVVGLLILLITSCNPTLVTEQQLIAYIQDEDNGLIKTKEQNGYKLTVYYKPTDFVINQYTENGVIEKPKLDTLKKQFKNYAYFVLSLQKDKSNALYNMEQGYDAFSETLQTLAFRMDQYVQLTTSNSDTIPVADFIYPRLYGASPSTDILFVFNNTQFSKNDWVQFNVKEFGLGVGRKNFRFKTSDIQQIPTLKFNLLNDLNKSNL